jgi:hypothetical protein
MSEEGAGTFLHRLTAKLVSAGVPNMVVGSFASSFHGIPRSSQHLDLVIDPRPEALRRFSAISPPRSTTSIRTLPSMPFAAVDTST